MKIDDTLRPAHLEASVRDVFEVAGTKLELIRSSWDPSQGTPVFTVEGKYTSRGWTEWTQGFLYGMALLHFDATGHRASLEFGRESTASGMAAHLTHTGVHDHGFNNVSTYGNLLRLMSEERLPPEPWESRFYSLALKVSGAVQAARWTALPDNLGYIYSFNGPHSLFIDTMRTLRVLGIGHNLGHVLMAEQDRRVSLLERLLRHCVTTARYNVFHGEGRDAYDVRGRVSHEAIFNTVDGSYRCPSSQQGYSAFSTWTRGLAWAICGFAEQLEYLSDLPGGEFEGLAVGGLTGKSSLVGMLQGVAEEVADYYIQSSPRDGIPYWDTGAPGMMHLKDYLDKPADPFNNFEPVDSSAAAIAAQGLIRLGRHLQSQGLAERGRKYQQAGLTVACSLFREPYLSTDPEHQGLILHSVYHRPNGWDHIPRGRKVPCGESSLWGDYHALELALLIQRLAQGSYFTFFNVRQQSQ